MAVPVGRQDLSLLKDVAARVRQLEQMLDLAGEILIVGAVDFGGDAQLGATLSPDEKTLLVSVINDQGQDLMLVEPER